MKHLNCSSTQSQIRNPQSAIRSFFFFLLPFYFLLLIACEKNTTSVAPPDPQLTLTVEDVAVTEAWLTLTVEDRTENLHFEILRDDSLILNGPLTTDDTTLYDANLLPAHSYTYRAELHKEGQKIAAAGPVSITTMDTTSHEFSTNIFSFGEKGSSMFYDVQIINENNIWVAGEIYLEDTYTYDSLGNWIDRYNAAQWNGQEWVLKRIPYIYNSQPFHHPLNFTFSIEEVEIWFGGNGIVKWDGQNFTNVEVPLSAWGNVAINKTWGSSHDNVYIIGNQGHIAHYNGQSWKRIESNTNSHIKGIWGIYNTKNDEYFILCTASVSGGEKKLLQIHPDHSVTEIDWSSYNKKLHSVWFQDTANIFLCGGGVYVRNRLGEYTKFTALPAITTNSIHGQGINDIFVVGDFGVLAHYSGISWKQYTYFDEVDIFRSIDYKEDLAVAVGIKNDRAVIYMLKKI